ncbi:MAG: low-specificity L-threonine aldolase [Bacteroidetes bacterium]|nr:low-specificity L-threonine aldolase [Bacteroidota bacterium]
MRIVDLRSDTVTKPTDAMRAIIAAAPVGDDVFNEDPSINELQETVARMFGMEAALFVPSGTMSNQIALKTHTQPGNEVICEWDSHIFRYEAGAAGMLSGIITKTLIGQRGVLSAAQIEAELSHDDIHSAPTGLIALENTHNRAGGTLYPIEQIAAISKMARSHQIPLHLDGARLMNACVASRSKPMDFGNYFDTISLCLSKGLGAPVGSVLVGSNSFIEKARYYRKAFGGGMRQAGLLAAAGLYALRNNVDRLQEDHENASFLAQHISRMASFELDASAVQTNIVIFEVRKGTAAQTVGELEKLGILAIPFSEKRVRFVTHMDVSLDDMKHVVQLLQKTYN